MALAAYDPVKELQDFVKFSDPIIPLDKINQKDLKKIKARIRYRGLKKLEVNIPFNPMDLRTKWLAHQFTSTPSIDSGHRSGYVETVTSIISSRIKKAVFIVGAGIDAPIVHTANLLDRVAKEKNPRIKSSIVREIVEQILFCAATELNRRLAEIAEHFKRPVFTENWSRNLSKFSVRLKVRYLFKNRIILRTRKKELYIILGSEIDTDVWDELKDVVAKVTTKFIFFIGTSLKGLVRSSIDAIKETERRIPFLYFTLMPDEEDKMEHLPKSLRGLKSALVV